MRLLRLLGLLVRGIGIRIGHFRLLAVLRDDISLYKSQNGDDAQCNKDDVAVTSGQILSCSQIVFTPLPIALGNCDGERHFVRWFLLWIWLEEMCSRLSV